jgi:hypothetical protein
VVGIATKELDKLLLLIVAVAMFWNHICEEMLKTVIIIPFCTTCFGVCHARLHISFNVISFSELSSNCEQNMMKCWNSYPSSDQAASWATAQSRSTFAPSQQHQGPTNLLSCGYQRVIPHW